MKKLSSAIFILLLLYVKSDKIIRYNGYFDEVKRREILENALLAPFLLNSLVESRKTHFSDFDLVKDARLIILPHPLIRDIQLVNNSRRHLNFRSISRRRSGLDINVAEKLQADKLWAHGYTGKGIRIAIFDTGLTSKRANFHNVVVERDYTDEHSPNDSDGHGTFVAGVIAGSNRRCTGIAPEAELYIYKVFGKGQESRTSWFLDAFNDAIQHRVDIINLSIGGTDYKDRLFMDKIEEIISRGIIFVSAVGNDGPSFGSVNNPADHPSVIAVGAINSFNTLAIFSSRGMTTSEFPEGYGRIKPDIVTYGVQLKAADINGRCKVMSGTSIAAPVITGSIALLLSSVAVEQRNSVQIHQVLKIGAERLTSLTMFEQGAGRFDLLASFSALQDYQPQITLSPSYFDITDCPYMGPYCSQPLYYSAQPLIINITIHNGHNSSLYIKNSTFNYDKNERGDLLQIGIEHSNQISKYGFLALFIQVSNSALNFTGLVKGQLELECEIKGSRIKISFPIQISIISTPPKSQRILWDQYRNLYYPLGFVPRDNLRAKAPLDWQIDHPHTNFYYLYNILRSIGYFIEVSGRPISCIDLSNYVNLIIIDPEDEYFPQEVIQIHHAVKNKGLNLIVVGNWYNKKLLEKMSFEDSNLKQPSYPITGGANVPAINELLNPFGFALGDQVVEGTIKLSNKNIKIASGSNLKAVPTSAWIVTADLNDIVSETLNNTKVLIRNVPVFGIDWPTNSSGFVALFGDSECFETARCASFLVDIMKLNKNDPSLLGLKKAEFLPQLSLNDLPTRLSKSNFSSISRVVKTIYLTHVTYRDMPLCSKKIPISTRVSTGRLNISFHNDKKWKLLQEKAITYFKTSTFLPSNILSDPDYQDDESTQIYIYRLVYFISAILLILFLCVTFIPRRLKTLIIRPIASLHRAIYSTYPIN